MDNREKGYTLFKKGLKYKEIAVKLCVPESTVRSWATRYWKTGKDATEKVATKKKKVATDDATFPPKKPRGAQKGNVNGVGNKGGAPHENQNAVTHGGYAKLLFSALTDDEKSYYQGDDVPEDEESMLLRDIRLLDIRIARLMQQIKDMRKPGGLYVDSVSTYEEKRRFETEEEKETYNAVIQSKVDSGERLPGTPYKVTTTTKNAEEFILSCQEALNRAQAQKQRCVDSLIKLREIRRAENPNTDIEDLQELRKAIFG